MRIFVKDRSGKTIALQVSKYDTIDSVKARIHIREGIPPVQQDLSFNQRKLLGERLLHSYNVTDGATIFINALCCTSDVGMEVLIGTEGQDLAIFVKGLKATDTIDRVKDKIQDMEGIPKSLQRLIFEGVYLEDEFRLMDYNIQTLDVLTLVRPFGCGWLANASCSLH